MIKKMFVIALAFIAAVSVFAMNDAEDVDAAEDGDVKSYYFYGDHPYFRYEFTAVPGMILEWIVTDESNGASVPFTDHVEQLYIEVDLTGVTDGPVKVVQNVYMNDESELIDTETVYAYPLHISGEYEVVFMDGSREFDRQVVDHRTMVEVGMNHVVIPADPSKDGYRFDGWYSDRFFKHEFNANEPIEEDTIVYAKWIATGSGSGGGGTVVIGSIHTVSFNIVPGLEYEVTDVDNSSVTFTVGVVGGYQLKNGTLSVTSDHGRLSSSGMTYVLSGVDANTLVTIGGELSLLSIDDSDPDFPWWIIFLVILIAVVIILLIWWKNRKENDGCDPISEGSGVDPVFETFEERMSIGDGSDEGFGMKKE